jgi:PAS domain S-box-containing protein
MSSGPARPSAQSIIHPTSRAVILGAASHTRSSGRRRSVATKTTNAAEISPARTIVARLADTAMPGMLWSGDASGQRTFFNQQWLQFTGSSEARQVGHGWLKGLSADDQRRYLEELQVAAREQRSLRTSYRLKRSDGQSRLLLEEARPCLDSDGRLIGFIGVCLDIDDLQGTEGTRAETDGLRSLSGRLERAREEERSRLARELHDELGQVLTSTKLDLMWLCEQIRGPDARPSVPLVNKLQSLAGLVELAITSVQRITTDLKPAVLDHLGLEAAMEWEATKFQARTAIRCRVESRLDDHALDPSRGTALFRIVQESLTNVARHAHAGAVQLSLRQVKGRIVLAVQDNGRGITEREVQDPRASGLLGMRERAHLLGGEFRIAGKPGRGTRVTVSIPARGPTS